MKHILLVFLGGGLGSVLRFVISRTFNLGAGLPYGTLVVNLLGSLLIGWLFGMGLRQNFLSNDTQLLLATGFCGGFTTFSAFALENHNYLRSGEIYSFAIYAGASVILGLAFVFFGMYLGKNI